METATDSATLAWPLGLLERATIPSSSRLRRDAAFARHGRPPRRPGRAGVRDERPDCSTDRPGRRVSARLPRLRRT